MKKIKITTDAASSGKETKKRSFCRPTIVWLRSHSERHHDIPPIFEKSSFRQKEFAELKLLYEMNTETTLLPHSLCGIVPSLKRRNRWRLWSILRHRDKFEKAWLVEMMKHFAARRKIWSAPSVHEAYFELVSYAHQAQNIWSKDVVFMFFCHENGKKNGRPVRIRTSTKWTRITCATVTPQDYLCYNFQASLPFVVP